MIQPIYLYGSEILRAKAAEADIDDKEKATYPEHLPFIQTPTFSSNIVGEVSFRARKYNSSDHDAQVTLFGSTDASEKNEGTWKRLTWWPVTTDIYTNFIYRTDPGQNFRAFRLAVTGVPGVHEDVSGGGNLAPEGFDRPVRVLLDEIYVSEAVRARMGFKNVGCFRTDMSGTTEVPNVPSTKQQPLWQEAWGVQAEIYGAQLSADIDFNRLPRVKLHWYTGVYPWGYENWKDIPANGTEGAHEAWLTRATGTEEDRFVYRSSQRTCPDAVVPMATDAPTYVQYTLEVVYYTKGSTVAQTNWLSRADWTTPSWYYPLDFNAQYGTGTAGSFAAYNILDSVAPGWAWINEFNIFGEYGMDGNTDADRQYFEIAQPVEADLSDWSVRVLEPQPSSKCVFTNVVNTFGAKDLTGLKDAQYMDPDSRMVFRVLANKQARDVSRYLKTSDGTLDGIWDFQVVDSTAMSADENGNTELTAYYPLSVQLVRKSGIIEHEILFMGTNWWSDLPAAYQASYGPTNSLDYLKGLSPNSSLIYVNDDDGGLLNSRGVVQNAGRDPGDWSNAMAHTPGRINEGQYINPDRPMPAGEDILIYATIAGDHILQSAGGLAFTNSLVMMSIPKGSRVGTNLIYRVDPWYTVGAVTANGVDASASLVRTYAGQPGEFELRDIGKGVSNNVTIIASAAVDPRLANEFGVAPDNEYREAIIKWLERSRDLHGNMWADVESGEIRLADFCSLNGTVVTNMTLTQMYWLDMDPTVGNLALIGGMYDPAHQLPPKKAWDGRTTVTNVKMGAYLMITNRSTGASWAPYALRGKEPDSSSINFNPLKDKWNSVTFKVTGLLLNGYTSTRNLENWMPLRWFVFREDSFDAGRAQIEIEDPYCELSIGYNTGWGDWWARNGWCPVVYFWSIDTRLQPVTIEVLKPENPY